MNVTDAGNCLIILKTNEQIEHLARKKLLLKTERM